MNVGEILKLPNGRPSIFGVELCYEFNPKSLSRVPVPITRRGIDWKGYWIVEEILTTADDAEDDIFRALIVRLKTEGDEDQPKYDPAGAAVVVTLGGPLFPEYTKLVAGRVQPQPKFNIGPSDWPLLGLSNEQRILLEKYTSAVKALVIAEQKSDEVPNPTTVRLENEMRRAQRELIESIS